MTRRTLVGSLALAATLKSQSPQASPTPRPRRQPHTEWKPRLGVLGPYTPANVEFAKSQGFTNMILSAGMRSTLDANTITDEQVTEIKNTLTKFDMHVSAFQIDGNHIDPDPERRARENAYVVKAIDLAGKLGVPYIGTQSGKDASKPFQAQVDEIVRVYHEQYFPACERNHVAILWEPYPESPNIATARLASKHYSRRSAIRPTWAFNTIHRTWCANSWTRSKQRATSRIRSTTCT